jgi:hypothetical protein
MPHGQFEDLSKIGVDYLRPVLGRFSISSTIFDFFRSILYRRYYFFSFDDLSIVIEKSNFFCKIIDDNRKVSNFFGESS